MALKEQIIIPYRKHITIPAIVFCSLFVVLLILSIALSQILLALLSISLAVVGISLMIQNQRVILSGGKLTVKHFLGIIKDVTVTPVDCGVFVSSGFKITKRVYVDRRVQKNVAQSDTKYIYFSEYVLSKQEQEGSSYDLGEPILIIPYTEALYTALRKEFQFNCEVASTNDKHTPIRKKG